MGTALVVYESVFGDSRTIAQAIGEGLREHGETSVVDVREAPGTIDDDVDVLVVGGPTHQLGMTRPSTRRETAKNYPDAPEAASIGLREWLADLHAPSGVRAAAFDTRLSHPKLLRVLDHAGRTEQKLLRRHGLEIIAPAEPFLVESPTGPLVAGEVDRARSWGDKLGAVAGTPR